MSYPKPLSEKTIERLYREAGISNEMQTYLHPGRKARDFLLTIWCIYDIIQKDYYIVSLSADTGIVHFPVA